MPSSSRTKTKALPKSKAKNAYDLLSEVVAIVLAEPKRYDQARFIERRADGDTVPRGFPACGTVGCVAGWIVTLKGPPTFEYKDVERLAQDILGPTLDTSDLFFGGALPGTAGQTKAHAKAGAAHIRAFQNDYEKQLRAKRV